MSRPGPNASTVRCRHRHPVRHHNGRLRHKTPPQHLEHHSHSPREEWTLTSSTDVIPGKNTQAHVATPWLPVLRDGDSIPCSMTFALLAFRRGSLHSSPWKDASCSSLWTCALRVGGYGTRVFSRNRICGISQGPFLSRGMPVVLKALWRSSSVMMPHGIPLSAPDGAGIRPRSRHPGSQCLETAIRSRAP